MYTEISELNEHWSRLFDQIENQGGEITEEQQELLKLLESENNRIVETLAGSVAYRQSVIAARKGEIERLELKNSIEERKIEGTKRFFLSFLKIIAKKQNKSGNLYYETPLVKVTQTKSESLVIADKDEIPAQFITVKTITTETVDKGEIKKALKNGIDVPGVEIQHNESITIK